MQQTLINHGLHCLYIDEVKKVGEFNIQSGAKITKVTEDAYAYPQPTFADVYKCLEALSRKWALPKSNNFITRETVRFSELKKLMPGIASTILSNTLVEIEHKGLISKSISKYRQEYNTS